MRTTLLSAGVVILATVWLVYLLGGLPLTAELLRHSSVEERSVS